MVHRKMSAPDDEPYRVGASATTGGSFFLKRLDLEKSILILGPTGVGKTTGFIDPFCKHLMNRADRPALIGFTVKDPYGQSLTEHARAKGEEKRVIHLRPGGEHRINLLDPEISAAKLAATLTQASTVAGESRDPKNAFWIARQEMDFATALDLARVALGAENVTLREMRSLFTGLMRGSTGLSGTEYPKEIALLLGILAGRYEDASDSERADLMNRTRALREDVARFVALDDKVRTSVIAEIDRALSVIASPEIERILCAGPGDSTFTIRDVIENGLVLVVDLPAEKYGRAGRIASAMIRSQAYSYLASTRSDGSGRLARPVFFILDEGQSLLRLGESEDSDNHFSGIARGLGARLVIASQQMEAIFAGVEDPFFARQLVENCRTQILFKQPLGTELQRALSERNVPATVPLYLASAAPRFSAVVLTDNDYDVVRMDPPFLREINASDEESAEKVFSRRIRAMSRIGGLLKLPPAATPPYRIFAQCPTGEECGRLLDQSESLLREEGVFYLRIDGRTVGDVDPGWEFVRAARFHRDRAEAGVIIIDRIDLAPSSLQAWRSISSLLDGGRCDIGMPSCRINYNMVSIVATAVESRRAERGLPLPELRDSDRRVIRTLPPLIRWKFRIGRWSDSPSPANGTKRTGWRQNLWHGADL